MKSSLKFITVFFVSFLVSKVYGQTGNRSLFEVVTSDTIAQNWDIGLTMNYGENSLPFGVNHINDLSKIWNQNTGLYYDVGGYFNFLLGTKKLKKKFSETFEFAYGKQLGRAIWEEDPTNPLISVLAGFHKYSIIKIGLQTGVISNIRGVKLETNFSIGMRYPMSIHPNNTASRGTESIPYSGLELGVILNHLDVLKSINLSFQKSWYLRNNLLYEQGTYYYYSLGLRFSIL